MDHVFGATWRVAVEWREWRSSGLDIRRDWRVRLALCGIGSEGVVFVLYVVCHVRERFGVLGPFVRVVGFDLEIADLIVRVVGFDLVRLVGGRQRL